MMIKIGVQEGKNNLCVFYLTFVTIVHHHQIIIIIVQSSSE